jgi:hypothetical protein
LVALAQRWGGKKRAVGFMPGDDAGRHANDGGGA